jgi:aspartate racemase
MKTIGIIGGLAWPSTITYYSTINRLVSSKLGPEHCAELILVQADFKEILHWIRTKEWELLGKKLLALAKHLESSGADFIVIACNTVHRALPLSEDKIALPILHIVDASLERILQLGLKRVGLIGSPLTMTDEYFAGRLADHQVEVVPPSKDDQRTIHDALRNEFVQGLFLPETRVRFKGVISRLAEEGAEAVILGCTEFGILLKEEESPVLLIDTAVVHCEAAVSMAMV